jgi:hypothetical protein
MTIRRVGVVAAVVAVVAVVVTGMIAPAATQGKDPSISSGWVKLPPTGATSTEAYLTVDNPTMYDFYLQKVSTDVAGSVEFREAGKNEAIKFVTVTAYETLDMNPKAIHLLLKDLKKPLADGDKVRLAVVTDGGLTLNIEATVKNAP